MTQEKTYKVLIVRFSSIGDIVLTTPVIRCLRLQLNAEIHYLTKVNYQSILISNPHVHKVWTIKKSVGELKNELRAEQFDYVIDLHKNLRTLHLRLILGVKIYAFNKLNFEKWLITKFKINRLPNIHIVDRYLETIKPLGVKNDDKGLDYFIPQNDVMTLPSMLGERQFTIAFAIGAAHRTKCLPTEKIISICQKITQKENQLIVLLGGKDDIVEADKIMKAVQHQIVSFCGSINLNQSASIVQQVDKVITHDTGLMHIAAAFQKEIISVWGNTVPAFGMYPYVEPSKYKVIEVNGLSCRPCSKIGHQQCPKGHFNCMMKIDESLIEN